MKLTLSLAALLIPLVSCMTAKDKEIFAEVNAIHAEISANAQVEIEDVDKNPLITLPKKEDKSKRASSESIKVN